jgi:hypothetical protein
MKQLLSRGTNGKAGYTPFEGWTQAGSALMSLKRELLTPIAAWAASLALAAAFMAVTLWLAGWSLPSPLVIAGLGAIAAVAERGRVRINRYMEESISLLPTLFAAVIFGPLAAMVVAAASMLGAFGSPYMKWATYTSARSFLRFRMRPSPP